MVDLDPRYKTEAKAYMEGLYQSVRSSGLRYEHEGRIRRGRSSGASSDFVNELLDRHAVRDNHNLRACNFSRRDIAYPVSMEWDRKGGKTFDQGSRERGE